MLDRVKVIKPLISLGQNAVAFAGLWRGVVAVGNTLLRARGQSVTGRQGGGSNGICRFMHRHKKTPHLAGLDWACGAYSLASISSAGDSKAICSFKALQAVVLSIDTK